MLSSEISPAGLVRVESGYCFPAEIAHGAVQAAFDTRPDFLFLPHFRDMESYENDVHANFCPITQGLPYYIRQAFPEISDEYVLSPVVSFKYGEEKAIEPFISLGRTLGIGEKDGARHSPRRSKSSGSMRPRPPFSDARHSRRRGARQRPVIAVLGRPYNAFTPDANMGIPRKFTTRGCSVIPFDILPFENEDIFANMYWYYGQQDMKASKLLKNEANVFVTWITNFSCAPDSFMLHYLKWIMGTKPFLVLELDSHSADAGIDTRVEAFLDILDGYRSKITEIEAERYDNGLRFLVEKDGLYVRRLSTGERMLLVGNPRIKLLLSNMGRLSTEFLAASLRSAGISAEALPLADTPTLQLARNHASGKECVPSHLLLGEALRFFGSDSYRKDETLPALRSDHHRALPHRPVLRLLREPLQGPAPRQRGGLNARLRQFVQRARSGLLEAGVEGARRQRLHEGRGDLAARLRRRSRGGDEKIR